MRILLITGRYPPTPCGVGDYTQRLAKELSRYGHELCVYTSGGTEAPVASERDGDVRVLRGATSWGLADIPGILAQVSRQPADLVHLQYQTSAFRGHPMITLLPWRVRCRRALPPVKVVVTLHELAGPVTRISPGPLRRGWLLPLMSAAHAVVVTNERDASYLRHVPVVRRRLHVIPLASNLEVTPIGIEERRRVRAQLGLADDEVLLVRFGFVHNVRASLLDELLRAVRILRAAGHRVTLLLVGGEEAASRSELLACARRLGVDRHLVLTGYGSPAEVSRYLQAADLGLQLYARGVCENRSTLQTVMAHALPVVSIQKGAPPSMFVQRENVLLIPRGDAAHIAAAVTELLVDAALRVRLGRGASGVAATFTWAAIGAKTDALYRMLLA